MPGIGGLLGGGGGGGGGSSKGGGSSINIIAVKKPREQPKMDAGDAAAAIPDETRDTTAPASMTGQSAQGDAQRDEEARLSAAERRRRRLARLAPDRLRERGR